MKIKHLFLLPVLAMVTSCCCSKQNQENKNVSMVPGPPTIVYKTNSDYYHNVPVQLNSDGTIASYPDPSDLTIGGELAYPTRLEDGYLLDNKGISTNVAFIEMTYEEYSKLGKAPSTDELQSMVIDEKPLKEMYNCGLRSKFNDPVKEINAVIKEGGKKALKKNYSKLY